MNEKNKQKIIALKSKEEDMDYDAWVEEISKANNKIIDEFEQFLKTEKLSFLHIPNRLSHHPPFLCSSCFVFL